MTTSGPVNEIDFETFIAGQVQCRRNLKHPNYVYFFISLTAFQLGVNPTNLRNFHMSSKSPTNRRELLSMVWTVGFDLVTSLGAFGADSAATIAASVREDCPCLSVSIVPFK